MKILICCVNAQHLNLTQDYMYEAIERAFDVTYYGPGHQPLSTFCGDIKQFYEETGPYDIVILPMLAILDYDTKIEDLRRQKAKRILSFDMDEFLEKFPQYLDGWRDLPCHKLLNGFFDTYVARQERIDQILEFPGHVLEYGSDFLHPLTELKEGEWEKEGRTTIPNDLYLNTSLKHPEKFIPTMHVLSDDFACHTPFVRRNHDIAIPGAHYAFRKLSRKKYKEAGYKVRVRTLFSRIAIRVLKIFNQRIDNSVIGQKIAREDLRSLLATSKTVMTDGMRLKYGVRKMLEIPAQGALMLTDGAYNMERLGFQPNKHYLSIDEDNLVETLDWALANPEKSQAIIDNGQKLVQEKHTVQAWVYRFRKIFPKLIEGTYKGSYWSDGELVYRDE